MKGIRRIKKILLPGYYYYLITCLRHPKVFDEKLNELIRSTEYNPAFTKWVLDNLDRAKEEKIKDTEFPLSNKGVVFDVGGFEGHWSKRIFKKYNPTIYFFEPVKEYFQKARKILPKKEKIKFYNFGLLDISTKAQINIEGMGSSLWGNNDKKYIKIMDIHRFLNKEKIKKIDLMKINIEGGEYRLIKRLIQKGDIKKISFLLVQFHNKYHGKLKSRSLRKRLRKELSKTHECIFNYPYIWECWRVKTK